MQGPGQCVVMGCMYPAVGLQCKQAWAANLFKHCIMMADQHAVVRKGCRCRDQDTRRCIFSKKQTHLIHTLWTLVAGFTPFFTSFAALSQ